MKTNTYKLISEDGFFHVEGPDLNMASLNRFVQLPLSSMADPAEYALRSAQRIVDMLNTAFNAGQNTPKVPSFIAD